MSKSNRGSSKSIKSRRRTKPLDLPTARRMLPLIERIVNDILRDQKELNRFSFEQEGLDRDRHGLSWPERERRYAVQGEVTRLQSRLDEEVKELDLLGTVLMNRGVGLVGFPTIVNGKPAYFSWQHGENGVLFWHFDGEDTRRPIPPHWFDDAPVRLASHR
jgi:hypothetical protein